MKYICMDDMIMKRAKCEQLAINTKATTNTVLYTTLGVLVGAGYIGLPLIGQCIFLMSLNKVTKVIIDKTGVINKVIRLVKKEKIETTI